MTVVTLVSSKKNNTKGKLMVLLVFDDLWYKASRTNTMYLFYHALHIWIIHVSLCILLLNSWLSIKY